MVEPIAFTQTIANWHRLTRPRASELEDTRKQLHWAAQLVSAVGTSLCPARSDDSHTNLEWSNAHNGLLGRTSPTAPHLRAVLQFPRLTVELLRDQGGGNEKAVLSLPLANMTFSQAFARLEAAVAEQLGRSDFHLQRPKHHLPAHRVDPDGE